MDTVDPLEGQAAANGWLQILSSEGFDITLYLKTESDLHVIPMQLTHPSYRIPGYDVERKLVFDFGERPSVSWDWWISPSSPAFLLREEFKVIAVNLPDWFLIAESWREAWPIMYPAWSEGHQWYGDFESRKRRLKLLNLVKERAMRRLDKRAGLRRVPGAWPLGLPSCSAERQTRLQDSRLIYRHGTISHLVWNTWKALDNK